jgi:hypothetical protein
LSEEDLLRSGLYEVVNQTRAVYDFSTGPYWCPLQRGEKQGPLFALIFSISLCGVSVDELFDRVAAFTNDKGLGDAAFVIKLFVGGQVGPRCGRDDPSCGPEPNGVGRSAGRCVETVPVTNAPVGDRARGRCGQDGECQITCENFCMSWTEDPPCPKERRAPDAVEEWCGCVEGRCAWLREAPRAP